MIKNKRFGEVTVKLSSYGMEEELHSVFQSNILFFTLQFFISLFLLLLLFYLKITKPLQSLLEYISNIGDHQLQTKATWHYNDEISTIGKAFEKAKQTITDMSITDSLTGVSNHYMLRQLLQQSFRSTLQHGQHFTLVLIDINNFKQINDYYGHAKGDVVLKELATLIQSNIESGDYFGRWSGEEFMLIYQNKLPKEIEPQVLGLNQLIEKTLFDVAISLSCSFGITGFSQKDTSIEHVIKRADKALGLAKGSYSNNIIII